LRAKTLLVEAWTAQEEILRQALDRQKQLEAARTRNREESKRLEAYRAALPAIGALQELEAQLEPLKPVRLLDESFITEHRRITTGLHTVRTKRDAACEEVKRLEAEVRAKQPQGTILAEEQTIERLKEELSVCLKAERDRLGLYARMREHQGNARNILRKYFRREDLNEAESLRLSPAAQERIRALGEDRKALLQAIQDVQGRFEQLDGEITEKAQLAAAPEPADVSDVDSLYRSILQEGPLEKNEREATDKLAADRNKAETILKRLACCWRGTLEQVPTLPVPLPTRVQV
jgi:hypothetical protein